MNDENLKPFHTLSESEQREIRSMGGKASGEARRARKALKEELLTLLENGNSQNRLCLALLEKAFDGDVRAFETIRDTIGEKPTDKTVVTGEFTQLVLRRLGNERKNNGDSGEVSAADRNQEEV